MEQKDLVAMVLLITATGGGIVLTCLSKHVRDLFFFLMIVLSAMTERVDVNFMSRDWYRGTTRGFEVSLVDVLSISLLVSSFLFPRRGNKRWFWPPSLGMILFYFAFAAFCVSITDPQLFGLFQLSKMLRGMIIFLAAALFIRSERELRILVLGLGVAVCYEGFLAVTQRYVYGIHRVSGSVDDSNSLSMYLCTTAAIFVAAINSRFPKYLKALCALAIAFASVAVVLTISRTGVVTLAFTLVCATIATISFKITVRKIAVALVVMAGAGAITAKSWNTLKARFAESTLQQEYENKHNMGRGYYIRIAGAIAEERWFGVGPNNWSFWVSNLYGPKLGWKFVHYSGTDKEPSHIVPAGSRVDDPQAAPAHSLGALTTGEMGYGGLMILILMWLRWLQMGASFLWPRTDDPMRRMAIGFFFGICGTFLQSLTEWVFHQTPIFYTFNIIVGALASLYYVKKCAKRAAAQSEESATSDERPAPEVFVHEQFVRTKLSALPSES
jgi:hypothetical protein